jgi:cobalt-zinc-cadmium efflux system membrane fusion protein
MMILCFTLFTNACDGKKAEEVSQEKTQEGKTEEPSVDLIKLSKESKELAEIKTDTVDTRSLKITLQAPGKVQANENHLAHVGSRIPGRVVEVLVNLGDYVNYGQTLAGIDSTELGTAQSDYLQTKAKLVVADQAYERAKKLLQGKVISTGEYQRREGEYLTAKAEAQSAEDHLHLLGMDDESITQLGGEHSIRSQVKIKAPFAGTIIERHMTVGEVIDPSTKLFAIADLTRLWVIADIPEKDLPLVKKGQPVEVSVSAYPAEVFKGKITYLSDLIDPATRTAGVRTEVENPKGMLKPEMFANVLIVTGIKQDALTIPASALQTDGEKKIVFIAKDPTTFQRREISLGAKADGYYQVMEGLNKGEKIVTEGSFLLKSELHKGQMEAD